MRIEPLFDTDYITDFFVQILLLRSDCYDTGQSSLYKRYKYKLTLSQVFLTQVYSGTGSAGHLSAFLIPQYALMFVTMTALTAYSLVLIF